MTGGRAPNPFAAEGVAHRYLRGRPESQAEALERVRPVIGVGRVDRGLDVACGPGPSTRALAAMAHVAIGIDAVEAMVREAVTTDGPRCHYVVAAAEGLPFPEGVFDLVTVGSAVHWFDQARFTSEARRVLAPGRWLVVYEHHFLGAMEEVEPFEDWMTERYLERYPIPPRGEHPGPRWTANGFEQLEREEYPDGIPMTKAELIDYLMTQSNIAVPVDRGDTRVAEVEQWLESELVEFFPDHRRRTMRFWGVVNAFRST